jgi:hypothetical protein
MGTIERASLFPDTSNNTNISGAIQKICALVRTLVLTVLFLTILSMKQWMYVEVRPHICGDSRCEYVNSLW